MTIMSRKVYEGLAAVVAGIPDARRRRIVACGMRDVLLRNNPAFNECKWMTACGVVRTNRDAIINSKKD